MSSTTSASSGSVPRASLSPSSSGALFALRMRQAADDFRGGVARSELWLFLGWRDVRKHYSRSILGPFWLTLSMGVMVTGLGLLYSQIFGMEIGEYLPFLAVGFIAWGFIAGIINGACTVFSGAAGSIRQVPLPLSVYLLQFLWSQLIVFGHNFVIYIAVAILFGIPPGLGTLMFLPALLLITLNGLFVAMILGPLCARFRDIPMIVASVTQVAFFMTPILWSAQQLPERALFVGFNPFYHFMEIVRDPLLGGAATPLNWLACLLVTALLGTIAILFFARFRARVPYWA